MKMIVGAVLFIQNYDIKFLYEAIEIPQEVLEEFTDNQKRLKSQAQNLGGGYDFVFAFRTSEAIRWLMNQDYIVDYNEASICRKEELLDTIDVLKRRYNEVLSQGGSEAEIQAKSLEHCIKSYNLMLQIRDGELSFDIPTMEDAKKLTPKKGLLGRFFQ